MNGTMFKRGLEAPSSIVSPETFKPPKRYSLPDTSYGVKVKVQIMQRVKGCRVDLAGDEQVPQVRARARAARVAVARQVRRPLVVGIARVLDVDPPFAREQLAVPRVPRR